MRVAYTSKASQQHYSSKIRLHKSHRTLCNDATSGQWLKKNPKFRVQLATSLVIAKKMVENYKPPRKLQ
jgi:hypothetical protein